MFLRYKVELIEARAEKCANAVKGSDTNGDGPGSESDIYDTNLTKDQIQKSVNVVNAAAAALRKRIAFNAAIETINACVDNRDTGGLVTALSDPIADLSEVESQNVETYLRRMTAAKLEMDGATAGSTHGGEGGYVDVSPGVRALTQAEIQDCIDDTNASLTEEVTEQLVPCLR